MTHLLLITDCPAVLECVPFLEALVECHRTVGAARRLLAEPECPWIGLVAWGPDVVAVAEEHWRLDGPAVAGVEQLALRAPFSAPLTVAGMTALGLWRCVVLPGGLGVLDEEVARVHSGQNSA